MNILNKIFTFLSRILSRVHLVSAKDEMILRITRIKRSHGLNSGSVQSGSTEQKPTSQDTAVEKVPCTPKESKARSLYDTDSTQEQRD